MSLAARRARGWGLMAYAALISSPLRPCLGAAQRTGTHLSDKFLSRLSPKTIRKTHRPGPGVCGQLAFRRPLPDGIGRCGGGRGRGSKPHTSAPPGWAPSRERANIRRTRNRSHLGSNNNNTPLQKNPKHTLVDITCQSTSPSEHPPGTCFFHGSRWKANPLESFAERNPSSC